MLERLLRILPGEQHGKLLAAIPERPSASAHLAQPGADHPEQLIAHVVAVLVVEALEVIDVHHGDRVRPAQPRQRFVERATGRQPGQLVAVGHAVPRLDQREHQDQAAGRQVDARIEAAADGQRQPRRDQRPDRAALERRAQRHRADRQDHEGEHEGEPGRAAGSTAHAGPASSRSSVVLSGRNSGWHNRAPRARSAAPPGTSEMRPAHAPTALARAATRARPDRAAAAARSGRRRRRATSPAASPAGAGMSSARSASKQNEQAQHEPAPVEAPAEQDARRRAPRADKRARAATRSRAARVSATRRWPRRAGRRPAAGGAGPGSPSGSVRARHAVWT